MESDSLRDIQDGVLGALQQIAGIGDPGVVHVIQRRGVHDVTEYPAEVGGAPVAQIRQVLYGELLAVIQVDIVQSGSDGQGVALLLFLVGGSLSSCIDCITGRGFGIGGVFFCPDAAAEEAKILESSMYRESRRPLALI